MLIIPAVGRLRHIDSCCWMVSQPGLLDTFQAADRPCLLKRCIGAKIVLWPIHAGIHSCIRVYMYTHKENRHV